MHQHNIDITLRANRRTFRVARQGRHIVDDGSPGIDGPAHHFGMAGIDGNQDAGIRNTLDDRQDTRTFLVDCDRLGAGARRLATDIKDCRTVVDQFQGMLNGNSGVEKITAVGETVRRHVDHPHQARAVERKPGKGPRFRFHMSCPISSPPRTRGPS